MARIASTTVWVRFTGQSGTSWYSVYGTSLATPLWAAIVGAGSNIRNITAASQSSVAELKTLYEGRANQSNFRQITDGVCGPDNGYLAGGAISQASLFDLCTGIGSPVGFDGK